MQFKPSEVVRGIIGRRLGCEERSKGEASRCTKLGHRLVSVGSIFAIHPPKTSNDPYLSERLVDTVRENGATLIWAKPSRDKTTLDVWALPPKAVLEMWANVQTPTKDRDGSSWDTQMDHRQGKWYWRPCGKDRSHLVIDVTQYHEPWKLTAAEQGALR